MVEPRTRFSRRTHNIKNTFYLNFSHSNMSMFMARRMMPTALLGIRSRQILTSRQILSSRQVLSKCRTDLKQVTQLARLSSGTGKKPKPSQNMVVAWYCAALATFILGVSYASVPLYKVFCSMTGSLKS